MSADPTRRARLSPRFVRYGVFLVAVAAAFGLGMWLGPATGTGPSLVPLIVLFLVVVATVAVYRSLAAGAARRDAEASAADLRDLIELAPEAFFLADLDGHYVDVNRAACTLLGYTREELLRMRVADLVPPEEHQRLEASRSALLSPDTAERGEWTLIRKDRTIIPAEVRANIVSNGRWQAFVRDITGRKRVEREQQFLAEAGAVLASSLDYEQTLTTLGELVVRDLADFCIIDLVEEHGRPRRLKVTAGAPGLAGAAARLERIRLDSRRPSLVSSVLETKSPFLLERVTPEALASFAQSAEHLEVLRELDPKSVMGVPLSLRGQLLGVLVFGSSRPSRSYGPDDLQFARAIAERAALAIENGHLYQSALRATQLRDEVLAVVAHDLRNPLSLVLMQARMLERRGAEPERRNQRPRQVIVRAADRMNRLIQDLLDVSLIEAGQLGIQAEATAAREILLEAVEAQRPMASSGELEIRFEWPDELPEVWADPHRLEQVLENLIGNAVKFTSPGGLITVGAASIEREVLFWVGDTGSGISPDELPHVFDRFWRTSQTERSGAGLGLAITRGIVEAHGGRIWAESAPGRGSVFFFTVPTAAVAATRASEPAPVGG